MWPTSPVRASCSCPLGMVLLGRLWWLSEISFLSVSASPPGRGMGWGSRRGFGSGVGQLWPSLRSIVWCRGAGSNRRHRVFQTQTEGSTGVSWGR